ncbi:MAG: alpha/beta hydrolase [Planctomycetaceae bacterium]
MSNLGQVRLESLGKPTATIVCCLILLACGGLVAGSPVVAQEKSEKSIEEKVIPSLADGLPLKATYYKSSEGKDAAVVLLLHMKGESRLVWSAPLPNMQPPKSFAEQLQGKGFAVLAVDLRKHGQSKLGADTDDSKKAAPADKSKKAVGGTDLRPLDYQLMVRDMDAIKRFIYEEHQKGHLNMRKMAIVAPGMSAAIGITFAAEDWRKVPWDDAANVAGRTPRGQDVQAMVFLSPEITLPGVAAHQVIPQFKAMGAPMAALILVGSSDKQGKEQALTLFKQLGGEPAKAAPPKKAADPKKVAKEKEKEKEKEAEKEVKERLFYIELNAKIGGTELLGKKLGVEDAVIGFLTDHVQTLKGPDYDWRDRKSRLE